MQANIRPRAFYLGLQEIAPSECRLVEANQSSCPDPAPSSASSSLESSPSGITTPFRYVTCTFASHQ